MNETGAAGQRCQLSSLGGQVAALPAPAARRLRRPRSPPAAHRSGTRRPRREPRPRVVPAAKAVARRIETARPPSSTSHRREARCARHCPRSGIGAGQHGLPRRPEPRARIAPGRFRDPPARLSRGEHVGVTVTGEQLDAQQRRDGGVEERILDTDRSSGEPAGAEVSLPHEPGAGAFGHGSFADTAARLGEQRGRDRTGRNLPSVPATEPGTGPIPAPSASASRGAHRRPDALPPKKADADDQRQDRPASIATEPFTLPDAALICRPARRPVAPRSPRRTRQQVREVALRDLPAILVHPILGHPVADLVQGRNRELHQRVHIDQMRSVTGQHRAMPAARRKLEHRARETRGRTGAAIRCSSFSG